ncbi:MAG TPA: hypothetical protein V6D12_24465, partial [Candidatus Obscuribacterales bacterium]
LGNELDSVATVTFNLTGLLLCSLGLQKLARLATLARLQLKKLLTYTSSAIALNEEAPTISSWGSATQLCVGATSF